ncbi:MAG: hypothetical protein WCQ21_34160 [Verrucomicrobiota bacterium]
MQKPLNNQADSNLKSDAASSTPQIEPSAAIPRRKAFKRIVGYTAPVVIALLTAQDAAAS